MLILRVVTAMFLVAGLVLSAPVSFCGNGGEIKIKIDAPEKEAENLGAIVHFRGQVRGWEGNPLYARIHGLGRTRQVFLDAEDPWMTVGHDVNISVVFIMPPGGQTVTFDVYRPEDQKVLVQKSTAFTVVAPDESWMEEQLDGIRWGISAAVGSLQKERSASLWQTIDKDFTQEDAKHESEMFRVSVWHAYNSYLLPGYTRICDVYDRMGEPGKALGALALAEDVYAATKDEVITGPGFAEWPVYRIPGSCSSAPHHFLRYRFFYERHGMLEELEKSMEREVEWFQEEMKRDDLDEGEQAGPVMDLATVYRDLAYYHVMLADDLQGYRKWMGKFREVLPEKSTAPPHTIWLSVYTRDPQSTIFGIGFDEE